jgi:RNA polymerase sigma factor (sigma-70 family)
MGTTKMAGENHGAALRGIERIFNEGSLTGLSEGQLLARFAVGDEGAFEALVTRHGPMVRGVCRRLLYEPRDVEDAFQATFLVLLRRAGGLRDAEGLAPWLHGVAYRVAARIRARVARRPGEESRGARPEAVESTSDLERTELRTLIDEEIRRLPEKYRRPVVLCYLEGRTHEEAARRLRCSAGSVRGRLDRARQKLKDRLVRRGVAPAAGLTALAAGGDSASAAVPAPLIAGTIATLARAATATAVSGTDSASALELADGVFRAMIVAKVKLAASFLAAAAIFLAVGAAWLLTFGGSLAREGRESPAPVASRGDGPAGRPQDREGEREGPSIEIRVVDQRTGRPLPGVALAVEVGRNPHDRTTTDDAGRAAVAIPERTAGFLSVVARKEGFATVTLWFPSPVREEEVPPSYMLKMYPAETVGGVVHDEQGRPVAGVRVAPTIWTSSADIRYLREDIAEPAPAMTDSQGRWQCAGMPTGIDPSRVSIRYTHPDYEHVNLPNGQALVDVRRGKATVLPRGLDLTGRVVDPSGRAVLGAKILRGSDRFGGDVAAVETDEDGRFRFAHAPAGEAVLTVQALGFAPALETIVVRPGLAPVEFRLQKGRTIRGRVVDARGEPLAGASIYVDGWRGHRTLDWRMTADEEGGFRWTDAPPDSFWIHASREGYLGSDRREVPPAGGELTITLVKQLKVRGTVVDAETRHAIQSFTLVPGTESGGGFSPYWDRGRERRLRKGRYEILFEDGEQKAGRRLRVEAEGYMPAVSQVIRDDEDDPVVNFVLHKGAGVSGVVRRPDGTPLAGADVVLVVPSQPAFLTNGRPPTGNDHRVVKTGGDGRFAFPPQEPPYTIVVLHDRGFAEQTIRNADAPPAADLTVRPWGRVEGTLRIGNRPGAGQTLDLAYGRQGDTPATIPWWSGKATSDESGRFAFERVMPGEVSITREILLKRRATSQTVGHSHTTWVEVAPGATARVTVGGTGRPLVGKVMAHAGFAGPVDWTFSHNSLIPKETPIQRLIRSGARKGSHRSGGGYTVKLEADGSFRVEDVEAGTYDFIIVVNEPPRDPFGAGIGHDVIATARREVIVPPMPGGRSDEPLDLGAIPVEAVERPKAAPATQKPAGSRKR